MTNEEMAARYRKLYAGVVHDAMVFDLGHKKSHAMSRDIHRVSGVRRFAIDQHPLVGPVFTCRGSIVSDPEEVDDSIRMELYDAMPSGCVQVIATSDETVAHFGDVSGLLAMSRRAEGVVIDGYTRDTDELCRMNFSVFCRGSQPQDAYGRWQITNYDEPIFIEDATGHMQMIEAGDWIFADGDGVLAIPEYVIEDTLVAAEKRKANEDEIRAAILNGEAPKDIYARLGRW